MAFSDLLFIDKHGHDYGWSYDSDKDLWTGSVIIDKVSRGLFETEKIMCLQKYPVNWLSYEIDETERDTLKNGVKTYEYGKMAYLPDGSPDDYYVWTWDDSVMDVTEINMFRFDHSVCPPEDTSALVYNDYNCPNIELLGELRITELPETRSVFNAERSDMHGELKRAEYDIFNLVPSASVVDLCFCNEESTYITFRRDLFLLYYSASEDTFTKVAVISVYAECEDEDERFSTLCSNLGYRITNDDFKIFKDSDIKEQKVDYRLMNEKRKEMLMEGHNIYPYIGSYKSLINVIRYFGYDNIHIKEWWKNVDVTSEDYGNYFIAASYSLVDRESVRVNGTKVSLPSRKFRKTNKMTMAWDIDRVIKSVGRMGDAHDLPDTKEVFAFTIEEAVIKLYAFRRKLEKEFLPLNCHIVDMVGEMFGFDYSVIRTNVSDRCTFDNFVGCECDFNVVTEQEDVYLEDLRRFNVFNENIPQPKSGDVILRDIYDEYVRAYNIVDENDYPIMPLAADKDESFSGLENEECVIDGVRLHNGKPIELLGMPALYDVQDTKNGCTWNYYKYKIATETGGGMNNGLYSFRAELDFTDTDTCVIPCHASGNAIVEIRDEEDNIVECGIEIDSTSIRVSANGHPTGLYAIIHTISGQAAGNYYVANFSHYYPNLKYNAIKANAFTDDMNEHLPDNENALCGALVRLQCAGLGATWDDALVKWDLADYAWGDCENNIRNHQRVTWEIWKPEDDTQEFFTSITGSFKYGYGDIGILLPYVGKYSVRCVIRGFDNSISERIKTECVEVLPKNVEVTGWFKHKVDTYGCWNDIPKDMKWRDSDMTWQFPYISCDATWDEMRTATYESLNRATFAGEYYDSEDADERMVINTFDQPVNNQFNTCWNGMYFWDNLKDLNWLSLEHLDWNSTVMGGDVLPHFVLGGFDSDGMRTWSGDIAVEILTVDNRYGRFVFTDNDTDMSDVEYYTKMLNESNDEVISEFEYHYFTPFRLPEYDWRYTEYEIIAIAKHTGFGIKDARTNRLEDAPTCVNGIWSLSQAESLISDIMHRWFNGSHFNPTWIDTTYMNAFTRVPANTDVNLNYSPSRIVGKCCPQWEVRNLDNPNTPVITSTHKNFHHMFRDTGRYNVKLIIRDTNGNVYKSDRCMFEVI